MSNIGKDPESSGLRAGLTPMHPHPRRRCVLFWALAASTLAIIVAAGWPVTSLETPRWEVWVVDENGKPLEGMTVRLCYQNYSAEAVGHEQDLYTDATGHVVFPARTITVSLFNRAIGVVRAAQQGVHASFGPHAYVFVFGRGREAFVTSSGVVPHWTGKSAEMESRFIVP